MTMHVSTTLTHRRRYVLLYPRFSTPLLHSAPANAARKPFVPDRVRTQHITLSRDLRSCTLPVPLGRCSLHSGVDIQSKELSPQLASLQQEQ